MKYKGRDDLLLMTLVPKARIAGVLTENRLCASSVLWCRENLKHGRVRAVLVNAGNANAFTGKAGERATKTIGKALAGHLGCSVSHVFLCSTGVIGEVLPSKPVVGALPLMKKADWGAAAKAICTTDTFPKLATKTIQWGGQNIRFNAIAKGSGMIAPDMATMLAYIVTDAALPVAVMRKMLKRATENSFNAISVDGECSTNDGVFFIATQEKKPLRKTSFALIEKALGELCLDLALQVVRDGEGAQKLISVRVSGARSEASAKRIAASIVNSPLVKTAIAGEDANCGRVIMAIGKTGEPVIAEKLKLYMGGILVASKGAFRPALDGAPLRKLLKKREIAIHVSLGIGKGVAQMWGCDLTHGYIDINADYRS